MRLDSDSGKILISAAELCVLALHRGDRRGFSEKRKEDREAARLYLSSVDGEYQNDVRVEKSFFSKDAVVLLEGEIDAVRRNGNELEIGFGWMASGRGNRSPRA